ncbi:MAG: RNA pseudouridine synthase [Deltaproteobacteria bacterium]|nr:RNA pseudouridine synthase [Deltaproteobacteria bacterium]
MLFQSETCVVIDKPAGMPVQRHPQHHAATIEDQMPGWLPVHRLDNETSGCLLLAKTPEVYEMLRAQFERQLVAKTYLAIVHGLTPETFAVETPIAHHARKEHRMVPAVPGAQFRGQPQAARTEVTTIHHYYPNAARPVALSLVRIVIPTGVRHQIRVHLNLHGFPIVGDKLYGKRVLHSQFTMPRHLLHAHRLTFTPPEGEAPVTAEAPSPDDFSL